jgi:hypothetical protein
MDNSTKLQQLKSRLLKIESELSTCSFNNHTRGAASYTALQYETTRTKSHQERTQIR